jgi:hypothetical protein
MTLTACVSKLPDQPVSAMSDTELLIAFGQTARNASMNGDKHNELDKEVQARRLISAADAIKVQDAHVYLGSSSATALASFGAPETLGISTDVPGLQAWHYPYDANNSGVLFVLGGKVIGYRIAPEREPDGKLKWSQAGRQFSRNFEVRRCRQFVDSKAIVTNCPDLDVSRLASAENAPGYEDLGAPSALPSERVSRRRARDRRY